MGTAQVQRAGEVRADGAHARMLSEVGLAALRCAMQAHVRGGGAVLDARWRRVLRLLVGDVHRHRLTPEQMLVVFKQALERAADAAGVPGGRARTVLTGRLVTICIEEYFTQEDRAACDADAGALASGETGVSA